MLRALGFAVDSYYANLDENAPPPPAVLDMEASGFGRDSYRDSRSATCCPTGKSYCSLIRRCRAGPTGIR